MAEFDIRAIFQRMYVASGVENDNQLSKFLKVKPSTIQGWKIAKTPPFKACYEIYHRTGFTVEWLVDGAHPKVSMGEVGAANRAFTQKVINLPEDSFANAFHEEVMSGIRLDFLMANEHSVAENIKRLGRQLYRELNDEPIIPQKSDKEIKSA